MRSISFRGPKIVLYFLFLYIQIFVHRVFVYRGFPVCLGLKEVQRVGVGFHCPTCVGRGQRGVDVRQVRMGEASVEVVNSFFYLGDVIQCEGGAEVVVRGRVACAWQSWKELASLLVNQNIPLGREHRCKECA